MPYVQDTFTHNFMSVGQQSLQERQMIRSVSTHLCFCLWYFRYFGDTLTSNEGVSARSMAPVVVSVDNGSGLHHHHLVSKPCSVVATAVLSSAAAPAFSQPAPSVLVDGTGYTHPWVVRCNISTSGYETSAGQCWWSLTLKNYMVFCLWGHMTVL